VIETPPAARPRRLLAAAFLVACCLVAALADAAVPALAGKPKKHGRPTVTILAPHRDARVQGKALKVRVRASSGAAFRADVSGTDVSGRFHRHGKLLEATLRRGRDYRVGENLLAVSVGKGRTLPATVPFVAMTRAKGLLKVTKLAAHGTEPLRFRIRASAPLAGLRVAVDRHRYPIGPVGGKRRWTIAVGASDGVHFGANTIVVVAERKGAKRFDRERLRFRVGRGTPLAGAGKDLTTRTGKAVVLRGGSTKAGTRKGALIYRWEIVEKPRGSHARIAHGTSRDARLLPDLPGSYRVRLTAARVSKATAAKERGRRATASSVEAAAQPTCLEAAPVPLTPAAKGSVASTGPAGQGEVETSTGPLVPLTPLEAPVCVTPIGEPAPPPLPLEAMHSLSVDEAFLTSLPTESPLGWSIETLAADGSTRVGPQIFKKKEDSWVHMVVLSQKTLTPVGPGKWGSSNQYFLPHEAAELQHDVEETTEEQVVILTGMGEELANPPVSAQEALANAIAALGVPAPEQAEREEIAGAGNWSVIGTRRQPGRTHTNLHGLGEQPIEGMPATLPGSLNGWMMSTLSGLYAYVSPEAIPIDTKAEGSSNTLSVFELGGETVTSAPITNGSLALHIAVFDLGNADGKPTVAANYTDVIDDPYVSTNQAGVKAAAEQLERWRVAGSSNLIVMQTFGEEAVGQNTAPWASASWVNDALIPDNPRGLFEWDQQPYLRAKNEAELADKQDARWNPGYPTVAGQVGDLTGEVGHDLVSIFGGGNTKQVEVTRLTMIAENHPESTESNYVDGYAAPSPGRLAGTLVRNARGGLQVESGSGLPPVVGESFRELVFSGPPTPWPYASGRENEKALEFFARELWPRERFKTPREAYLAKSEDEWLGEESQLRHIRYEAGQGFGAPTFRKVKEQLEKEMLDLAHVQKALGNWRNLFGEAKLSALVNAESIGAKLVEQVEKDGKKKPTDEAEISPEAVVSEALYILGDLSGFPEDTEFLKIPEIVSMVASGIGLAEELTPETPEQAEGPNSNLIRAKGTELGVELYKRLEAVSRSLTQFELIFASDWGRLKAAGELAPGPWTFEAKEKQYVIQSFAINTEKEIFEGLLPMAYTQWVIAPYPTFLMPRGPEPPGNSYLCRHWHETRSDDVKPFGRAPEEALDTAVYRPFDEPGSKTLPAQPYTTPFTIRSLKSDADPPEVFKVELTDTVTGIEIHHGGADPPKSLLEGLFETPIPEEEPAFPKRLGINKSAFFAGYGEGPTEWKRVICAEG
jgi:hypothetical protein